MTMNGKIPSNQITISNGSKHLAADFSFKLVTKERNLHKQKKKFQNKSKSKNHCAKTGIRIRFDPMIFTMTTTTTLTKREFFFIFCLFPYRIFQIRRDQVPCINWFSFALIFPHIRFGLLAYALIIKTDFLMLAHVSSYRRVPKHVRALIIDDGVAHTIQHILYTKHVRPLSLARILCVYYDNIVVYTTSMGCLLLIIISFEQKCTNAPESRR